MRTVSVDQEKSPEVDGRSSRWDRHRTARRLELARIARRAIHHGGPELSMDEIAGAAGTSKSIFYRYFTDKTGLQAAVGELVLADIGAVLEEAAHSAGGPPDALRAMISAYLEMIEEAPNVYRFVTRPTTDAAAPVGNFLGGITELIAAEFDGDQPPLELAAWAAGVVGYVRGVGEWWLTNNYPVEREVLAQNAARSLWQGKEHS